MDQGERISFYAQHAGVSRAAARRYVVTRVGEWTTRRDRKIGGLIRMLEVLASDDGLTWAKWRARGRDILEDIHDFIAGVLDSVAAFVERVGRTVKGVLRELRRVLEHPILRAITALFASVVGGRALRA